MIKKVICCMLVWCMLTSLICVFADTTEINALYNPENRKLLLTGNGSGSFMITVVKKMTNEEGEDVTKSNISAENLPLVFKQIESSGEYLCTLTLPESAPLGKYMVYLSGKGGETESSFLITDVTKANGVIKEINEKKHKKDKSGFKKLVSESLEDIGIDGDDEFYLENKNIIFDFLYKTEYKDITGFTQMYNRIYALSGLVGKEKNEILNLIDKLSAKIDSVSSSDVINDDRLSERGIEALIGMLSAGEFVKHIDDEGNFSFDNALERMKALSDVMSAEYWGELKDAIVNEFSDCFLNLLADKTYGKIKDKDKVFEKMISMPLGDIDAVIKSFESSVKKVYNEEQPKKPVVSGGSAGGGGGGGVTTPKYEAADTNDLPKLNIETSEEILFSDLSENDWSFEAVSKLKGMGIISGFPDGTFMPHKKVTRAEFTKMILYFTESVKNSTKVAFSDVNEDDWYYSACIEAAGKGIIMGNAGGFYPNDNIKREDAAMIIYRVLSLRGEAPIAQRYFPDRKNISSYAKEAVEALGSVDIIKGDEKGNFMPQASLSRAEAAQLIYNAFVNKR